MGSLEDPTTQESVRTFTIITTAAAPSVRELHERMPVFLPVGKHGFWLDARTPVEVAQQMLLPLDGLRLRLVSRRMNNSKNKSPDDAAPIED